ncbi:hypothetical protein [Tuwongella immobilis]|uniref:SH3b domain-containing protein n=1 Tax=Tuwongella immobilis TaxID=692036 RepID=A0A6C2YSC6_9BACT|nr:hypothetical protein [Tuwongella immobilis]VIP04578.1 Uncharacterized protein OS=Planctomyces maris DSM 8797 GN=PM8797T_06035 PE=4 SV=1: SH3_4 [Tuwongella immobilis]VTS06517.1 Uncharacterized protein OS=Planctomyces maris DSM 8797 GN=PM8797T_06035 PE=4 SV=1: SH3_4 [Tuwongella immobilis]
MIRTRIGIVIVGVTLALGRALAADPASPPSNPVFASIASVEVPVRCGPTDKYAVASYLRRGDRVQIHHIDGDYLAITPPTGSVSWVNHRFLSEMMNEQAGRANAILLQDRVEIRIGCVVTGLPLPVKQLNLPRGTIVEIIGPKVIADNSTWYPIVPPAGEYRYILRTSVGSPQPGESVAARVDRDAGNYSGNGSASPIGRPVSEVPTPQAPASNHPLWLRAEQLEASGDYAAAQQTYAQLAQELQRTNGDYELSVICYNRINRLQQSSQASAASMSQPMTSPFTTTSNPGQSMPVEPIPTRTTSLPNAIPATTSANPNPNAMPVARTAANPLRNSTNPAPSATNNPPAASSESTTSGGVARLQSSGEGLLRRCGFSIDGRAAYVLESYDARYRLYVTAQPGVNLESYLNREVELIGSVSYRGDIRGGNFMSVSRVNLVR